MEIEEEKMILYKKIEKLAAKAVEQCEKIELTIFNALPIIIEKGLEK